MAPESYLIQTSLFNPTFPPLAGAIWFVFIVKDDRRTLPFWECRQGKRAQGSFSTAVAFPLASMPCKGGWKCFHFGWIPICLGALHLSTKTASLQVFWEQNLMGHIHQRELQREPFVIWIQSKSLWRVTSWFLSSGGKFKVHKIFGSTSSELPKKDHLVILTVGYKWVQLVQGEIASHGSIT